MFGQWMHHAFPHECPFPHVAGATTPRTPDEWMDSTGAESLATPDEMREYVEKAAKSPAEVHAEELTHWTPHEELLVPRAARRSSGSSMWCLVRNVMFVGALAAFGMQMFASTSKAASSLSAGFDGNVKKCSEFECPTGWRAKAKCSDIEGFDELACCNKVNFCRDYQCPEGWSTRKDQKLEGSTTDTCCEKAPGCREFTCPVGWTKKQNCDSIAAYDRESCCA